MLLIVNNRERIRQLFAASIRKYQFLCIVIVMLSIGACTVEIDTNIRLIDNKNPPIFKLSGTGCCPKIFMGGPYAKPGGNDKLARLWEIEAISEEAFDPVWRLSPITYGILPNGFSQRYPEQGQPMLLEEGKYYTMFVHVFGANPGSMVFKIQNNVAVEVKRE